MSAKETILVVDDDPSARSAVTRLLQSRGYTVHALRSGEEAIAYASQNPFDVLITDFKMPGGLDGLTTVRAVRHINPQVVAVMLTGHSSIDLAIQSLNLGVHGFVVKPFTAVELTHTIERTLAQQRLNQENIKMKALVDVYSATQMLISADVNPARLPQLTLEVTLGRIAAERAYLFAYPESPASEIPELELLAVAYLESEPPAQSDLNQPSIYFAEPEHYPPATSDQYQHLQRLAQYTIQHNEVFLEIDDQPADMENTATIMQEDLSYLCLPMQAANRKLGAIILARYGKTFTFSELQVQVGAILANQAAIAMENVRLYRQVSRIEAISEADRLRGEFVATVSHELRTPLTSIKGYATTLLRPDVQWNDQTGTEYLSIISEECDRLMNLIDNILEVSKIEAGALRIFPEPIQLQTIMDRAVIEARRRSPDAQVELDIQEDNTIPFVHADPQRVLQVLRNLLHNAIKYSPVKPNIKVTLSRAPHLEGREQEYLQVGITDSGIGLSPEDKSQLFNRFYRVDNSSTRRTEGTGLGLAICRGIVEAHEGRIWVESEGVGKGSSFYFTLPVADLDYEVELD